MRQGAGHVGATGRVGGRVAGIAVTLLGASLWGLSGACAQWLFAHASVSPLFVTAVRMIAAGLLFLALLELRQPQVVRRMLADRETRRQLVTFGCGGLYLCQVTYVASVGLTNAGTATVLQSLGSALILAGACVRGRRLPRAREGVGLVCALAATALVATGGDPRALAIPPAGLAMGLANALTVAVYVTYPRRLFARWGSLPVTGLGMLAGGVLAATVLVVASVPGLLAADVSRVPLVPLGLGPRGVAMLGVIAVVGTFAAFGLYLHGVSVVGGVMGGLLGCAEPVSASVLSALWLGTPFVAADWAGLVLMIAMTVLISLPERRR